MLFAEWTPDLILFGVVMAVIGLVFLAVNWWLLTNHPDAWHKLHDAQERRRAAWQERQREKEAARRERNGKAMDAGVGLLKAFFGRR